MVVTCDLNFTHKSEDAQVVAHLLKIREDHAKQQTHDYSPIFRRKTRSELMRLSCIITGIEFAYAAETAFVSPILLEIGIEHNLMTMIWGISPFLGFFLAPLMASFSDRCRSSLGRRRPFIIALGVGVIVGLLLVPHGKSIGLFLGDPDSHGKLGSFLRWSFFLTIIGVVILDFNTENCQTLSRAYFLDVCLPEDHAKILSTSTIMGGMGGSMGYVLGAIDWNHTTIGEWMGGSVNTVYTLVTIIFFIGLTITITSFREIPWPLMKRDELLRPITHDDICAEKDKINGVFYIKTDADVQPLDPDDKDMFIVKYVKNIIFMPKSLKILCLTSLFSWMSYLSFCMYFTDFVGEAVFHGSPTAPVGSQELSSFEDGVRFGCWGMAIFALSCSIYSTVIEKFIKVFKGKVVYVGGLGTFSIGMGILASIPQKWAVLTFSMTAGVMYATLYTMPFLLIAKYHAKGSFKVKNGQKIHSKQTRGLGADIAIMGSMLFLGQLIVSLCMGSFITLLGSTSAVLYTSSFSAFCAAICATQVIYEDL